MTAEMSSEGGGARTCELCELGPLGVRSRGTWTAVRGRRTQAVVSLLSIRRDHGARAEELVEAGWPSPEQPATARQSLANVVARLRAAHGAGFIESHGAIYRLGALVASDRARFLDELAVACRSEADPQAAIEMLGQACARWRGEPWVGMEHPDELAVDRAVLLAARSEAKGLLGRLLLDVGRPAEAIAPLRARVADQATDERSWELLVEALGRSGDRSAALRAARAARGALVDCGLEPGAVLAAAEASLLRGAAVSSVVGAEGLLSRRRRVLFGRADLLRRIDSLLDESEVVCLVGPGGVGKTVLAEEVSARSARSTAFVDLTPVNRDEQVVNAVVGALGVTIDHRRSLIDAIADHLADETGDGRSLLVLDNCEQVIDGVAALITALVQRGDGLHVLVTSRQRLAAAEVVVDVELLDTSEDGPGVALFFHRARQFGVELDERAWRGDASELCAALDGLPLAIELAAARSTTRSPAELCSALSDRFDLLRRRDGDDRHSRLWDTVEWSWDLLDADERHVASQLAVFPSGATTATVASALGCDVNQIADVVERLADKSFVEAVFEPGYPTRVVELQTIQDFVLRQAESAGMLGTLRDAQLKWVDRLTIDALGDDGDTLLQPDPLRALDREAHEIRAALDHAAGGGDAAMGALICARLLNWWRARTTADEAVRRMTELLPLAGLEPAGSVQALTALALLSTISGASPRDVEAALGGARAALASVDDRRQRSLLDLRLIEAEFDDRDPSLPDRLHEVVAVARAVGSDVDGTAMHMLSAWTIANRPDEAIAVAAETWEVARRRSRACQAHARELQGLAAIANGDLVAREFLADALRIHVETEQWFCAVHCCESTAWWVAASGDLEAARALLGQTEGLRARHGRTRAGFESQAPAALRTLLGRLPRPSRSVEMASTLEVTRLLLERGDLRPDGHPSR